VESYHLNQKAREVQSLRGRVFHEMRENILHGRYKRDEAIKEVQEAEKMGVSRTPVREALRQLELEGLVAIVPNKGAVVTGIDQKDIADIYAIRSLIEGLSAKWAAERINEEQLNVLEEIIYLSEFHLEKNHVEQLYDLDTKFHEVLYEISGSRILKHVLSDFHEYVQNVRKHSLSVRERAEKSVEEHKKILEALRNRDVKEARKRMDKHIKNTIKNIVAYNKNHDPL